MAQRLAVPRRRREPAPACRRRFQPGRARENSPAFQRWVGAARREPVPSGTQGRERAGPEAGAPAASGSALQKGFLAIFSEMKRQQRGHDQPRDRNRNSLVAERLGESSRGLQSAGETKIAWRRGATPETRLAPCRTNGFNRRCATAPAPGSFRGLKSTATVVPSLCDFAPVCGSTENSEDPKTGAVAIVLPDWRRVHLAPALAQACSSWADQLTIIIRRHDAHYSVPTAAQPERHPA